MKLSDLKRGEVARIERLEADDNMTRKLLELGLSEGLELRLLHTGPFGRDPLAIEVNDRFLALRRRDASHVVIEKIA
jgi:ferrous iron transport protein A